MQKSKKTYILIFMTVALAFVACDRDTIYYHYESTPLDGWERNDTLFFQDIVVKASSNYKEEIGLRINDDFPFQSLFLVVEQEIRPQHLFRTDTLKGARPKLLPVQHPPDLAAPKRRRHAGRTHKTLHEKGESARYCQHRCQIVEIAYSLLLTA